MSLFTVDGVSYPGIGVERLRRMARVTDGENAGYMLAGNYERDLVGTYYHYKLTLSADAPGSAEYDQMYEILTAPVPSHQIVMPYGTGTLSFEAYIDAADDALEPMEGEENWWGGLEITFRAKKPQRLPT